MTTYFLKKEEVCDLCNGSGFIQDPNWTQFWQWFKSRDKQPTTKMVQTWWKEHGLALDDDKPYPPEEIKCVRCNGNGVIVSNAFLIDAIRDPDIAEAINIMVGHKDGC